MSRSRRPNGSGTIWQRSDGRWTGALYVLEADGRRVRRQVYGKTRTAAKAKLDELKRQVEAGAVMTPSRLTVGTYLEEWVEQIARPRVRPNTLNGYRFHIDRYLIPDLGETRLGQLSARELRMYLDALKRREVGTRTIRYVHATLRAALEDAVREELLSKNVAKLVRPPAVPRQRREPLTFAEVRQFLKSTEDDRLHALYVVLSLLGLRRSEAIGLTWDAVDLEAGLIQVRQGLHRIDGQLQVLPTKTMRSNRTIPLPSVVRQALDEHRERQERERRDLAERWPASGFVFTTPVGTPLDPDNCSKAVRAAMKRSGVRVVRMHDLRHGVVSVLLALGVPPRTVMDIVGHTGLEMTMNVYGHVSLGDKREALEQIDDLWEEQ